ncbi:hypothetical protein Q0812_05390 [Brevundimonas sp. 2R-24]|uniref:Uncharacterized protein n=1 Tax=Peiella sedimenti TaxID=3061083 RepID=A0ABT8SLY9_9CAUL|nr:hypothetical protein [Caulobacteraceae bacterium XZ-24]
MKLRAQITIDINVSDYVGAAEHQRRVEALMETVSKTYPDATLQFRERRDRGPQPAGRPAPERPSHYTGRMAEYD